MNHKLSRENVILLSILAVSLFLNIFGIAWGLPDRWNPDEQIAKYLRIASELSIISSDDIFHPTFYAWILIPVMLPYVVFLKIFNPHYLESVRLAASASWIDVASNTPAFAVNIYLIGRALSGILGAATVYLIYLIGKKIYNKETGLISAALLAVTMGFVNVNHFAKQDALISLLVLVSVYFCIRAVQENKFPKFIYISALFGGLCFSTKFNGAISIVPILYTIYLFLKKQNKEECAFGKRVVELFKSRVLWVSVSIFLSAFLIGTPAFIFKLDYLMHGFKYYGSYINAAASSGTGISPVTTGLLGIKNYLLLLVTIFGVPSAIFLYAGLFRIFNRRQPIPDGLKIILSLIIPYFIIMSSLQHVKLAFVKYIILIIPLLAIIAGKAVYDFIANSRIPKIIRYAGIIFLFVFSLAYSMDSDMVLVKKDNRYEATRWIMENIPHGSSVEFFSDICYSASSKVIPLYNVRYFERESRAMKNGSLFRDMVKKVSYDASEAYFSALNRNGADSDYLIVSAGDISANYFYANNEKERMRFIKGLFSGEAGYYLVKEFATRYPFYWNPNGDYASLSTWIFRKKI